MKSGIRILTIVATLVLSAATIFATPAGWNGRILFRDGNAIASINPDGTGLRMIAAGYEYPAPAPDGRIAAITATGGQLVVMNADGTNVRVLSTGVHVFLSKPAWSPDGTRIAFEDQGEFGFPADVDIINADGTGFVNLFATGHAFYEPAWSPDGKKLALSVNDLGPGSGEHIDIVNADGTGLTALPASQDGHFPNWSPDGTQIAFSAAPDVFRIKTDGTGLTNLTNGADWDEHPSWSPDGKFITVQTRRSGFDIWTMSAVDGSGRFALTDCDCGNTPHWTSWVDTSAGTNVVARGNGVMVTFSNVTSAGLTTVTTPSSCNGTPVNFQVGACYDIHTTALFTGSVNVCISYAGVTFLPGVQPSIWHGDVQPQQTIWTDVTTPPVDTVNKIVCGSVTSLSPFAILGGASNRPPVAKCRNVTKSAGESCNAKVTADEINNGSSDPDNDPITMTLSAAGPFPIGSTPVVLTVSDSHGASNQCSATVTVVDVTPPTITCPPPITAEFANAAGAVVTFAGATGVDSCGNATTTNTPPSGSTFPIGTTTVTSVAIDPSGNRTSCLFTVTVLGSLGVKQNALADLIALRASLGNGDDREQLDEAIGDLRASLNAALWLDQTHLRPQTGSDVFDQEKDSVSILKKLLKNKRISETALQNAITRMVKADRLLAEVAINQAIAAHGRPQQIAEAQRELTRGDSDVTAGKFDTAIEHYGQAWQKAIEATGADNNQEH